MATKVYCDASNSNQECVCTWGCVIFYRGKRYEHFGLGLGGKNTHIGEAHAIVKAIGRVKGFNINFKKVLIYCDNKVVVDHINYLKQKKFKPVYMKNFSKRYPLYKGLIGQICKYYKSYNLYIEHIPRKENLAHEIAYNALKNTIASRKSDNPEE